MTYDQMIRQINEFLEDVYPGANDNPTKLVTTMVAADPEASIKNEAIVLTEQESECDETSNKNILSEMNKQLNNDFCPSGFVKTMFL